MEINKNDVGFRISNIRKRLGLTQELFGKKINQAHKSLVSKWEKGQSLPNNERLKLIAELGGITVDKLLYGDMDQILSNILNSRFTEIVHSFENNEDELDVKLYDFLIKNEDRIKQNIIEFLPSSLLETVSVEQVGTQIVTLILGSLSESPEDDEYLIREVIRRLDKLIGWIDAAYGKVKDPYVVSNDNLSEELYDQLTNELKNTKNRVRKMLDESKKSQ